MRLTWTEWRPGSPEAEGKAELIDAVVASITKWQGYTGGMSRVVSRVAGSLRKHRSAIHEARPPLPRACTASASRLLWQALLGITGMPPQSEKASMSTVQMWQGGRRWCMLCHLALLFHSLCTRERLSGA